MARYRFDIAYDGTAYAGWQIQPRHETVQQLLQEAVGEITGFEAGATRPLCRRRARACAEGCNP